MEQDSCILGCGRKRRKFGKECKQCYQRLWVQRKRAESNVHKPLNLSIEQAQRALDTIQYNDWWWDQ